MTSSHSPTAIQMAGGHWFDFADPTPDQVDVKDIARALSFSVRWGGHVPYFYSVAEHAVLVHRIVERAGHPADVCFAALHHDDHEAYVGDLPTPLKRVLEADAPGVYRRLVERADAAIAEALDIDPALLHHPAVKAADAQALAWEGRTFGRTWIKDQSDIPWWAVQGMQPRQAKKAYLEAHHAHA